MGGVCIFVLISYVVVWVLGIGDVRKCTDEEHSTWSGGKEIKDLLQCGWGEKKKKKEKNDKIVNYESIYKIW